jgi:CDP-diacylglycerol--serine O-phosphatidyltransferase
VHAKARGVIHFKDLFTMVNLVSGVIAVHYIFYDEPRKAGYSVLAGYLFGDLLDGFVARATGTSNKFGAELDSMVDHFVHVVIPALIVASVYSDSGSEALGITACGVLVGAATIRHARLSAAKFDYPICWCGLPRTISGFGAMALVLSETFSDRVRSGHWIGFAIIFVLSMMNLMPIPYMTHRGHRALEPKVKFAVGSFLVTTTLAALIEPTYTFDVLLFWMVGYAVAGWVPLLPEERRQFRVEYAKWTEALAVKTVPARSRTKVSEATDAT